MSESFVKFGLSVCSKLAVIGLTEPFCPRRYGEPVETANRGVTFDFSAIGGVFTLHVVGLGLYFRIFKYRVLPF